MNFKNKILALVMSFVICFCSVGNSFAYEKRGLNFGMTSPMLATLSTVAVASGVVFNSSEEIYNFGRAFYDKFSSNQETIKQVFDLGVSIAANKVVSVSKDFLNYVKEFIDGYVESQNASSKYKFIGYFGVMPTYYGTAGNYLSSLPTKLELSPGRSYDLGNGLTVDIPESEPSKYVKAVFRLNGVSMYSANSWVRDNGKISYVAISKDGSALTIYDSVKLVASDYSISNIYDYVKGMPLIDSYNWGGVADNVNEKGELDIYVPSNLKDLVGVNGGVIHKDGLLNPPYGLTDGSVALPGVSNPSLDVTDDTFIGSPSVDVPGDVPNDSIFSNIRDFIISLVVPSDTFWTDTFGGFRDNFTKNFPMVDMSRFDDLVVGGKPFPNIYAYGSKIVDGDVINGIVDWLRPIIAGFIMICLMFFNYRKIYKLIRNSEPFGSIAQGSSDFRTGLTPSDPNPYGNLRDTLWEMRNEILRRERGR